MSVCEAAAEPADDAALVPVDSAPEPEAEAEPEPDAACEPEAAEEPEWAAAEDEPEGAAVALLAPDDATGRRREGQHDGELGDAESEEDWKEGKTLRIMRRLWMKGSAPRG